MARCELDLLETPAAEPPPTPMAGTAEQLIDTIAEYEEIGVSELVLSISTDDVARIRRIQERFAEQVIPRVPSRSP